MNIWIVNHYAVPPGQAGGTRHWVLGRYLQSAGHSVSIIAADVNYQSRASSAEQKNYRARIHEYDGIKFLWLNAPEYSSLFRRVINMMIFAMRAAFGRAPSYLPRPDVIIGSTPHPFAAFAAYVLSRRYKARFVLEVRDIWPESLIELGGYSRLHPFIVLIDRLEKFLLRRADKIISLLPQASEDLVGKGAKGEIIVWIPNGVDVSLFQDPAPEEPGSSFKIFYAGAHGVANGLDVMLDAAKILQDEGNSHIRFVLIGDGTRKEALKNRAASMQLQNVEFRASVPKNEIPAVLRAAHACFMHLRDLPVFRWGVSPNKLFDYMAAARPVIFAVNTSANPVDMAKAGVTIPPEDPRALADAARQLASLPVEERAAQGARGRAYVFEHHGDNVLGKRLLDLLCQMTEGCRDRRL